MIAFFKRHNIPNKLHKYVRADKVPKTDVIAYIIFPEFFTMPTNRDIEDDPEIIDFMNDVKQLQAGR